MCSVWILQPGVVGIQIPGIVGIQIPGIVGIQIPGIVGIQIPGKYEKSSFSLQQTEQRNLLSIYFLSINKAG